MYVAKLGVDLKCITFLLYNVYLLCKYYRFEVMSVAIVCDNTLSAIIDFVVVFVFHIFTWHNLLPEFSVDENSVHFLLSSLIGFLNVLSVACGIDDTFVDTRTSGKSNLYLLKITNINFQLLRGRDYVAFSVAGFSEPNQLCIS